MKRITFTWTVRRCICIPIVLALIVFSGCSKSVTTPLNSTVSNYMDSPFIMTATIAGFPFNSDSCEFQSPTDTPYFDSTSPTIIGWLSRSASGYPFPRVFIYFDRNYHGIGTYNFSTTNGCSAQVWLSSASEPYAYSGAITIASTTPNVAGTFYFITTTGVEVHYGTFTAFKR